MPPKVFSFDANAIEDTRARYRAGDPMVVADTKILLDKAEAFLSAGPFAVTFKEPVPPSGDKHDFVAFSRYSWPNPNTPDGLPWILRDGESNPELEKYDREPLGKLCDCATYMALAYYLTGEERYAARTALLLRVWFLDPATRMNPHLRFAGYCPGVRDGSNGGIISTLGFFRLVDAVGFLADYSGWTHAGQTGLQEWFRRYREWLLSSDFGGKERTAKNNHGPWYDTQIVSYSLFMGEEEFARGYLLEQTLPRLPLHFAPDGSQPEELKRAIAKHYVEYNLNAWIELATMAALVGVDLWNYQTEDGRCIRKAVDWFVPYLVEEKEFPCQQINEFYPAKAIPHLRRVAAAYKDNRYREAAARIKGYENVSGRTRLLYR